MNVPVVDEHIEDAQKRHQKARRVLGLESHSHHDARAQPDDRDEDTRDGPVALEDEADKEENEQDTSSELEAATSAQLHLHSAAKGYKVALRGILRLTISACHSRSSRASPQRVSSCSGASLRGP